MRGFQLARSTTWIQFVPVLPRGAAMVRSATIKVMPSGERSIPISDPPRWSGGRKVQFSVVAQEIALARRDVDEPALYVVDRIHSGRGVDEESARAGAPGFTEQDQKKPEGAQPTVPRHVGTPNPPRGGIIPCRCAAKLFFPEGEWSSASRNHRTSSGAICPVLRGHRGVFPRVLTGRSGPVACGSRLRWLLESLQQARRQDPWPPRRCRDSPGRTPTR
jgi:hypothetical protein